MKSGYIEAIEKKALVNPLFNNVVSKIEISLTGILSPVSLESGVSRLSGTFTLPNDLLLPGLTGSGVCLSVAGCASQNEPQLDTLLLDFDNDTSHVLSSGYEPLVLDLKANASVQDINAANPSGHVITEISFVVDVTNLEQTIAQIKNRITYDYGVPAIKNIDTDEADITQQIKVRGFLPGDKVVIECFVKDSGGHSISKEVEK